MEEKQEKCTGGTCAVRRGLCSAAPFIVGLALALTFGWWIFPDLMFSQKAQPFAFNHEKHTEPGSLPSLECVACHSLRADGSFTGLPSVQVCASCHSSDVPARGASAVGTKLISEYTAKGEEIPWMAYQKQPDNVFFSHAAHDKAKCLACHTDWTQDDLCSRCHLNMAERDKNPAFKENVLTGYSRNTMKMWQCEECHAKVGHYGETNSNNACYTCHK